MPDVKQEIELFWEKNINKIHDWYILQKHDSDVIISASPEFLIQPICSRLKVFPIASLVDPKSGMYTGLNCYGEEKVRRFRELYPEINIEYFYSDSRSDTPLTVLSNKAFFVRKGVVYEWR